jgi:hypothetical protein
MKGTKYHVRLTDADRKRLREITKKGNCPARQIIRANILPCMDGNGTDGPVAEQETIAKRCGCHVSPVYRVGKQYELEGIERVLNRKARETPLVPPIVTGEAEAKVIALFCGEPPEGYGRRPLRLLAGRAVEPGIV